MVLAAEPSGWGLLAPVVQIELTPTNDPAEAGAGTTQRTNASASMSTDAAANATAPRADAANSTHQAAPQPHTLRHGQDAMNTLILAGITAVCLAILGTGLPSFIASLRRARRQD